LYKNLLAKIKKLAEDRTQKLNLDDEIIWSYNLMLDCCYSGSAIDAAKNMEGADEEGFRTFSQNGRLILEIYTAASGDQPAWDLGANRGSLFTNTWITKGIHAVKNQELTTPDGEKSQ
jgi:hypothetical protein